MGLRQVLPVQTKSTDFFVAIAKTLMTPSHRVKRRNQPWLLRPAALKDGAQATHWEPS
jgi:hypothetical protein